MFAYEDGHFPACGEVECCALDSGIVPFAVADKDDCGCGGDCPDEDCDCGMQGEIGDSCVCI